MSNPKPTHPPKPTPRGTPVKDETVKGYSGSPHEGEKPQKDVPKGHVVSPLGVTKPTPVITGKQN